MRGRLLGPRLAAIALIVLAVLSLVAYGIIKFLKAPKAGDITVGFGYDKSGKYISIAGPGDVEGIIVDGAALPGAGSKTYFKWESGRRYEVAVLMGGRKITGRHVAPALQPDWSLEVESTQEEDPVCHLKTWSVEVEELALQPAASENGIAGVYIPEYPPLGGTTEEEADALRNELFKAFRDLGVRAYDGVVEGGLAVAIYGGLPEEDGLLEKAREGNITLVFIGNSPEYNVRRDGVITRNQMRVEHAGEAAAQDRYSMPLSQWYPLEESIEVLARRVDKKPAVYRREGAYFFTAGIQAWGSPRDVVADVLRAAYAANSQVKSIRLQPGYDAHYSHAYFPCGEKSFVAEVKTRKRRVYGFFNASPGISGGRLSIDAATGAASVSIEGGSRGRVEVVFTGRRSERNYTLGSKGEGVFLWQGTMRFPESGHAMLRVGGRLAAVEPVETEPITAVITQEKELYTVQVKRGKTPYVGKVEVARGDRREALELSDGIFSSRYRDVEVYVDGVPLEKVYVEGRRDLSPYLYAASAAMLLLGYLSVKALERRYGAGKAKPTVLDGKPEQRSVVVRAEDVASAIARQAGDSPLPLLLEEISVAMAHARLEPRRLEEILEKMAAADNPKVVRSGRYYGLRRWEEKYAQGIEHLALMRAAQDYMNTRGILTRLYYGLEKGGAREGMGMGMGMAGMPDVLGRTAGGIVRVECETGGKKYSIKQVLEEHIAMHHQFAEAPKYTPRDKAAFETATWLIVPDPLHMQFREFLASEEYEMWNHKRMFEDYYGKSFHVFSRSMLENQK